MKIPLSKFERCPKKRHIPDIKNGIKSFNQKNDISNQKDWQASSMVSKIS